jgi:hypothetical protein
MMIKPEQQMPTIASLKDQMLLLYSNMIKSFFSYSLIILLDSSHFYLIFIVSRFSTFRISLPIRSYDAITALYLIDLNIKRNTLALKLNEFLLVLTIIFSILRHSSLRSTKTI